MSTSLTKNSV